MCGISGFWQPSKIIDKEIVQKMSDAIFYRGPDDGDAWVDQQHCIALMHRRLAIVDLSPAGHQPMMSECGRYIIVFNGEIYNHLEIRKELDENNLSPVWRGHSDTETLLAAIANWGIEAALQRLVGMFAFALWDKQTAKLTLARDRMGEKPLYFGWQNNAFLFASELKSLVHHPDFNNEVNRSVLPLYFRHSYIPAPYSIYKGIYKLQSGHYLVIDGNSDTPLKSVPYWSLKQAAQKGMAEPFNGTPCSAVEHLDSLLKTTISQQMMADVPIGAFLSGGVDSSTIVALMQSMSARPVKTFSIGFNEKQYNEAEHAKAVANYLKTEHTELYVTPKDSLDVIPLLPNIYDEPFADVSQIPTYLVSKLAKEHVTVSLSGDAGDEIFGGYSRYTRAKNTYQKLTTFPKGINKVVAGLSYLIPLSSNGRWGRKKHLGQSLLTASTEFDFYRQFVSHWLEQDGLTPGIKEPQYILNSQDLEFNSFEDSMLYADTLSYLPDDILVKVDRAAMAVSLETRVPLLDHRIVEWAWTLPQSMKMGLGTINGFCVIYYTSMCHVS